MQQPLKVAGKTGDAIEQTPKELPADYRSELHCALAVLAEAVEARHDYPLYGVRDCHFTCCLSDSVVAVLANHEPEVEQRLGQLFNEKRHSFRLLHQSGPQLGWESF